jgi:hypothetical protein
MIIKRKRETLVERFESFDGEYNYTPEEQNWAQMERIGDELL